MNESPGEQSGPLGPNDLLEQATDAMINTPTPPGPPPELIHATVAALQDIEPELTPSRPFMSRSLLMKSLSAAAGLLLAAGAALLVTTALQSPSMAFASAVEQLRSARTMSYTQLITVEGSSTPIRTRDFFAADGRHRMEQAGVVTIFDKSSMVRLVLMDFTKTALVYPRDRRNQVPPGYQFSQFAWLESLKELGEQPDRELGEKTIDGRRAAGFVATQANTMFTIWVDVETKELVRIGFDSPVKGHVQRIEMIDFEFNKPLEESLFSLEVPEGYTVMDQSLLQGVSDDGGSATRETTDAPQAAEFKPVPNASEREKNIEVDLRDHIKRPEAKRTPGVSEEESNIIEALRAYAKRTDGKFPPSITDWGHWAILFSKNNTSGRLTPETARAMSHLGEIVPFLAGMAKDDYEYSGKGKLRTDKNAIVFWYKTKDDTYRAIFSDLTVKTIPAEQVPRKSSAGTKR